MFIAENNTAERAVKITEEYNNTLGKYEDQKPYVIQIIRKYEKVPNANKEWLIK